MCQGHCDSGVLEAGMLVRSVELYPYLCRSVLFALLLTKIYDLRGTDIAVFTKVTQDGKLVSATLRARVFALPLFLT